MRKNQKNIYPQFFHFYQVFFLQFQHDLLIELKQELFCIEKN